jgi:phosphate transport system substrate-binding protein
MTLSTFAILVFGLYSLILTTLGGMQAFYTPYLLILSAGLLALAVLWIFSLGGKKMRKLVTLVFLCIMLVSAAGYHAVNAWLASIPTVSDQGVNLNEYRPFTKDSRAVHLDETSSLKIVSDLPRLDGATALYPLYAAFVQAVYPEKEYPYMEGEVYSSSGQILKESEVLCNTTTGAYERLLNGTADIIFCARPSKEQLASAKEKGLEMKLTPIGREAFVFFVNSKNPITGLTTDQIKGIYSGRIINWKDAGGKNQPIKAFQRPEGSGSQTMLLKVMGEVTPMPAPKQDVASGMGDIISQTADYKNFSNAIGFSFLYYATEMLKNDKIRLLQIDGITPSRTAIQDGTYPLGAEFYAITAGSKNSHVEDFIRWILSPQGQSLVEKTGYTPLP